MAKNYNTYASIALHFIFRGFSVFFEKSCTLHYYHHHYYYYYYYWCCCLSIQIQAEKIRQAN